MAFTPPVFNLLADIWFCGNKPADGDPDFENQECQLYLPSRVVFAIDRSTHNYFVSGIHVRIPFASSVNWASTNILEIPAESGRYFLAQFKEVMHQGFPNQYLVIVCLQCDENGDPIFRDVCLSSPVDHFASADNWSWIDNFFFEGAAHHG